MNDNIDERMTECVNTLLQMRDLTLTRIKELIEQGDTEGALRVIGFFIK